MRAGKAEPRPTPREGAPLPALAWVTTLTSVGTAVQWSGVFFVGERSLGFGARENLALAVGMGVVYALSALAASPVTRIIRGASGLSTRGVVVWALVLLAALSTLPLIDRSVGSFLLFAAGYTSLTGGLWPLIESYTSGGRRGAALRRATGVFNVSWAVALIAGMWLTALLLEDLPMWVIGSLAPIHLLSLVWVLRFDPEPAPHREGADAGEHEVDPARAARLLVMFRWCLLGSYVLHGCLTPMMPALLERLGVDVSLKPLLASVWMATRLGAFVCMARAHFWHGRVRTVFWAAALMAAGFAVPLAAGAWWVFALGLAVLGVGIGASYAAAIYYALEVGPARVDAGGKHEALIGAGYASGPLVGLALAPVIGLV